jgi:enoyl-CoA hydratase
VRLEASLLPVVAVWGLALAGGSELMMACDVIFASPTSVSATSMQYGLVPGWGGSQRLPRVVAAPRPFARWIDAPTALQWGLVNYVVEPDKLGEAALAYCTQLSTRSRGGLAIMKRLARQGMDQPLGGGLKLEDVGQ